jgi:hypothetical protein
MLREIKNMRGPSPCPKCGAAPKIEKHPPSFVYDGSVVFSCCAITSVADDITGAQAHWDGAVVGYRAGVEAAAEICAKHAGLPTGNDYENGWLRCACIVESEIRTLLNSEDKP